MLFHRKSIESNGDIIEMKIWQMPRSSDRKHGIKYSLVFIQQGHRTVGYDNAEGKGDHRHIRHREYRYHFTDVDTLIQDFLSDVEKMKRGEP